MLVKIKQASYQTLEKQGKKRGNETGNRTSEKVL